MRSIDTTTLGCLLTSSMLACAPVGSDNALFADPAGDPDVLLRGADAWGVGEDTAEACGVLRAVNRLTLDDGRGVTRSARATAGILAARAGEDGVHGTADDSRIDTLEELDAVPYVSQRVFARLLAHAGKVGDYHVCTGDLIELPAATMPRWNVCALLRFVNGAPREFLDYDLGLNYHAVDAIVGARPIESHEELYSLPYVRGSFTTAVANHLFWVGSNYVQWACEGDPAATVDGCSVMYLINRFEDPARLASDAGIPEAVADAMLETRPEHGFFSFEELRDVDGVSDEVFEALRVFARSNPGYSCGQVLSADCPGGVYAGVEYSAEEDCHAAEFMNAARFSQLRGLDGGAREVVYFGPPAEPAGPVQEYSSAA
jgi:hypothetical protein